MSKSNYVSSCCTANVIPGRHISPPYDLYYTCSQCEHRCERILHRSQGNVGISPDGLSMDALIMARKLTESFTRHASAATNKRAHNAAAVWKEAADLVRKQARNLGRPK